MTERTFTAAEMEKRADMFADMADDYERRRYPDTAEHRRATAVMLRQGAVALQQSLRQEARWEQLKVELEDYANQRGDEATSTYRLGAKSMAQTAVDIMARLEGERPHAD